LTAAILEETEKSGSTNAGTEELLIWRDIWIKMSFEMSLLSGLSWVMAKIRNADRKAANKPACKTM
jgi:hypothetical protein